MKVTVIRKYQGQEVVKIEQTVHTLESFMRFAEMAGVVQDFKHYVFDYHPEVEKTYIVELF